MAGLWAWQRRAPNASIVDVGWTAIVASRGDEYRQYQQTTSTFVP